MTPWRPFRPADGRAAGQEFGVRVGDHVDPHASLGAVLVTVARDGGEVVVRDAGVRAA